MPSRGRSSKTCCWSAGKRRVKRRVRRVGTMHGTTQPPGQYPCRECSFLNSMGITWTGPPSRISTSIIKKHTGLSDVDRLHYLKTSLHGPAADLVKDLPTTGENYQRTWDILQGHYENKRILVNTCLDKFAALPKLQERSVQTMSNLQNGLTKIANTLEGLGRPIDKSEDWCVYSIVNLFDPATRDKWAEKITTSREPPSFTTLRDFIRNQLHQLEVSQGLAI